MNDLSGDLPQPPATVVSPDSGIPTRDTPVLQEAGEQPLIVEAGLVKKYFAADKESKRLKSALEPEFNGAIGDAIRLARDIEPMLRIGEDGEGRVVKSGIMEAPDGRLIEVRFKNGYDRPEEFYFDEVRFFDPTNPERQLIIDNRSLLLYEGKGRGSINVIYDRNKLFINENNPLPDADPLDLIKEHLGYLSQHISELKLVEPAAPQTPQATPSGPVA